MGFRKRNMVQENIATIQNTVISVAAGQGGVTEITVQASTPAVAFKLFKDVRSEILRENNKIKQCDTR